MKPQTSTLPALPLFKQSALSGMGAGLLAAFMLAIGVGVGLGLQASHSEQLISDKAFGIVATGGSPLRH
jgi:hypothetical protein